MTKYANVKRRFNIGSGHSYRFTLGDLRWYPNLFPGEVEEDDDQTYGIVGIIEAHKNPAGELCEGYVSFCKPLNPSALEAERETWEVQSLRPLTISPSIQCSSCPAHGFIREDKWVGA